MSFTVNEKAFGTEIRIGSAIVFFGNTKLNLQNLSSHFPNYHFHTLHQVHGSAIVPAERENQTEPEADAHITEETSLGLVIKTADCVPAFLVSMSEPQVVALHAGWRGLTQSILKKGISKFSSTENLFAVIGPHIHWQNYELGKDVADKFQSYQPNNKRAVVCEGEKYFGNLTAMTNYELTSLGISKDHIWISPLDTFTTKTLNSYRENQTKRRNLSFVVRS